MQVIARVFAISLLFVAESATAATRDTCASLHELSFSEIDAPVTLESDPVRAKSMLLRLPIDCSSAELIVPKSALEATTLLDAMLPIELKASIVQGEVFDWSFKQQFGISMFQDLNAFLSEAWSLGDRSEVCGEVERLGSPLSCVASLLYLLRTRYRGEAFRIPQDPF